MAVCFPTKAEAEQAAAHAKGKLCKMVRLGVRCFPPVLVSFFPSEISGNGTHQLARWSFWLVVSLLLLVYWRHVRDQWNEKILALPPPLQPPPAFSFSLTVQIRDSGAITPFFMPPFPHFLANSLTFFPQNFRKYKQFEISAQKRCNCFVVRNRNNQNLYPLFLVLQRLGWCVHIFGALCFCPCHLKIPVGFSNYIQMFKSFNGKII